jgi:predicted 2-oxoglutarate/Fe(II)-dependent dioxygenase YbiX
VYVEENFLIASECASVCKEMRESVKTEAATYNQSANSERIDHRVRKTQYCTISNKSHITINNRIKEKKTALEEFFNTSLDDSFEPPKYLFYGEGAFFSPHTDDQLNRKINITINLNDKEAAAQLGYEGGALQLYGLIKNGAFSNRGVAAPSSAGCLIAYPVDIVHEVTPVIAGSRFSIVSRFLTRS